MNARIWTAAGLLMSFGAVVASAREAPLNDPAQLARSGASHYFAVGGPRHAPDEELSLIPRIDAHLTAAEREFVEGIEREPAALNRLHAERDTLGCELHAALCFPEQAQRSRLGEAIGRPGVAFWRTLTAIPGVGR